MMCAAPRPVCLIRGRRMSCSSRAAYPRGRSNGCAPETPAGPTKTRGRGSPAPAACWSFVEPPARAPDRDRTRRFSWSPSSLSIAEVVLARPDERLTAAPLARDGGWSTAQAGSVLGMFDAQGWTPAILLAQFARSADTPGIGGEMLEHAAYTAQLALLYVGATVLVVDPFDEDTDSYWREHWGFEPSEQGVPGNCRLKRLWAVIPR